MRTAGRYREGQALSWQARSPPQILRTYVEVKVQNGGIQSLLCEVQEQTKVSPHAIGDFEFERVSREDSACEVF